jgi:hypothetical protein
MRRFLQWPLLHSGRHVDWASSLPNHAILLILAITLQKNTKISHGIAVTNVKFCKLRIPWSKTKGRAGDVINITDTADSTSPYHALLNHFHVNFDVPIDAPLFTWTTSTGHWAPMTKQWFLERCHEIWSALSLPPRKGHAFRIGGTTHLLLLGMDPFIVMTIGCWTSNTFLTYWYNCDEILALFVGFSLEHPQTLSLKFIIRQK